MALMMTSVGSVPYLDLRISDGSHLLSDAKDLVHRLRKEWSLDEISSKEEGHSIVRDLLRRKPDAGPKKLAIEGQTDQIGRRNEEDEKSLLSEGTQRSIASTTRYKDIYEEAHTIAYAHLVTVGQFGPGTPSTYLPYARLVTEFSEGYNNKLVAFMHHDDVNDMSDVIVVRVYGPQTEMIVNREQEIKCMVLFHRAGCAAQLYCRFNNGFAYEYSPGRVFDLDLAYDPHVMRLLTKELARVHCIKPEASRTEDPAVKREAILLDVQPRLFTALDNFLEILPESFVETEKQAKLTKMAASREELKKEVDHLRSVLCPLGSPVVLCHNDLLFNNILYNDETQKVSFIDFEFAAFNYQAFDIATHFCEYAGMKVVDYSNLPDRSYQLRWLRSYLESYFDFQGRIGVKVSDDEVEKLYDQVNKFTLGSHMFWGMWALVQSKYSDIDYDFLDYARIRISEYYRRKQDFLARDADD